MIFRNIFQKQRALQEDMGLGCQPVQITFYSEAEVVVLSNLT